MAFAIGSAVLAVVGLVPASDVVAVDTACVLTGLGETATFVAAVASGDAAVAAPVVAVVAAAVGLTDWISTRATVATGEGATEADAIGADVAADVGACVGATVGCVVGCAAACVVACVGAAAEALAIGAADEAFVVGAAAEAFVVGDVFAVSSPEVRAFVVLLERVWAVLLDVALVALVAFVALVALLLAVVATAPTVATRVLALAELVLLLLTLVLATTTLAALLSLVAPLVTLVAALGSLVAALGMLVAALGALVALVAGVEGPAWLAPEADCALGIDHIEPNTTATTTSVDSPAWSHVRCAPVVTGTRCTACMPISPLPTRTDVGVSCAALGHDLN